jgi:hypothetical protein
LGELEVHEAGEAIAPPQRQSHDELESQHCQEPRPAGQDRDERQRPDENLRESRRARVDDVEVAVGIREPLGLPLHFGKYYTVTA